LSRPYSLTFASHGAPPEGLKPGTAPTCVCATSRQCAWQAAMLRTPEAAVSSNGGLGRSALSRDGLVERVPVIRRRHAGLDLVEHGYAILAVRHGGHAIALAKVSNKTTAEPPIAARVAEVPPLAALAYSQTDRIRAHADWRHHFSRAHGREYAAGR